MERLVDKRQWIKYKVEYYLDLKRKEILRKPLSTLRVPLFPSPSLQVQYPISGLRLYFIPTFYPTPHVYGFLCL